MFPRRSFVPGLCSLCTSDFLSLPATLRVHFLKWWIGEQTRSSYHPASRLVWNRQMFQGDCLELVFWADNSTISSPQSVIFTSVIYSNEGFVCFSSLCYFRSTLLSYLHYVWCVHRIPSDVCPRLYLVFIWIRVPLSRQNMLLLLSKQDLKLRCILFISHQRRLKDISSVSAVFAKAGLHTVKRKRNVRKNKNKTKTHHLDSEVHWFKDESQCLWVYLTVLHTPDFLPSGINLLSFSTSKTVSIPIIEIFACTWCIRLPRFSVSSTRLNRQVRLSFVEDEKHDWCTFRILCVCLLHYYRRQWVLVCWGLTVSRVGHYMIQVMNHWVCDAGAFYTAWHCIRCAVWSHVVCEKKSCGAYLAALHADKQSFIVLAL